MTNVAILYAPQIAASAKDLGVDHVSLHKQMMSDLTGLMDTVSSSDREKFIGQSGDSFSRTGSRQLEGKSWREYQDLGRYTKAPASGALGEGMKGERVREYQQQLRSQGYDIEADGFWGPKTQAAFERRESDRAKASEFDGLSRDALIDGSSTRRARLGSDTIAGAADRLDNAFDDKKYSTVNTLMTNANNGEMKGMVDEMGGRSAFEKRIDDIGGVQGDNSDYRDALKTLGQGERKTATEFELSRDLQRLKKADSDPNFRIGRLGTDEAEVHDIVLKYDKASLQELDRRMKQDPTYKTGLNGFINDNFRAGEERNLLLAQLGRPE